MQNAYWISDDGRPTQTVALKDIYGESFDVAGFGHLPVESLNPDLLLVSAPYVKAPAGAPTDSMAWLRASFSMNSIPSAGWC